MNTNEQDDLAAYAAAFDEDMAPPAVDDAGPVGGITPPADDAPAQNDGATGGEPAAVVLAVADGEQIENAEGAATADATTTSAGEDLSEEPTDPKELQRIRSWEGRLRAREAELARKEAELAKGRTEMPRAEESGEGGESQASEGLEQAAEQLAADGNKEGADAVEQVAEQVESGEITPAQAMKILADDFGEDFVKLIQTIAGAQAKEAASKVAQEATGQFGQTIEQVIGNIADDRERAHFEAIADAHPDFMDVTETPEFNEFIKQYPDGERIADGGTAREIVKLLSKFKEANKPAPTEPDPAIDAAQGVRSGGLRLPEAPVKAEGYEAAWDQF